MKGNFNQCFKYLLQDEGGYTNDPSDSGGATNLGITIKDYRMYINKNGTPDDVKTLTVAQAQSIYKSKYWDALGCDALPSGVDNAAFNYGVLAGIGRPKADLKRFSNIEDPNKLIDAICDEMQGFLDRLSASGKNTKFRAGWHNRVVRLRKNSHYMATAPKDTKSGPIAGGISGLSMWATMTHFFHQHETAIIISTVVSTILIGAAVHFYRNRKP